MPTFPRQPLLDALAATAGAVAARTTKPVLTCCKLDCDGETLRVTTYDTERGITVSVPTPEQGAIVAVVDHGLLWKIVKEVDGETVEIREDGKTATVCAGSAKFELLLTPPDEYPALPDAGERVTFKVPAGELKTALAQVAYAADKKDAGARFALTGILFEKDKSDVRLVATDSKRLATVAAKVEAVGDWPAVGGSILLPLKTAGLVGKAFDDGDVVSVTVRPNEMSFSTSTVSIFTRLIEGRYPPWRDIVSKSGGDVRYTIPRELFAAKVRQARIMTDEESVRMDCTFTPRRDLTGGAVEVELVTRGAAKGSSVVRFEFPGDADAAAGLEVAFDPEYVLEMLRAMGGETVEMRAKSGDKPVLFECGGVLGLVMPLTS